jgi:hypothetical protein
MQQDQQSSNRRHFLGTAAAIATGFVGSPAMAQEPAGDADLFVLGPRQGYSPQVGTLVSMLTMMRVMILAPVKGMTVAQLDYLHDEKANSIGAMLLHLAATERYYQLNTFDNLKWGSWDDATKKEWGVAMSLGAPARSQLKGRPLDYYLGVLRDVRAKSLEEFRKRDDAWLLQVDKTWGWGPTNNYAKWFHVCEHESNHNGQIKWIAGRLPGASASAG